MRLIVHNLASIFPFITIKCSFKSLNIKLKISSLSYLLFNWASLSPVTKHSYLLHFIKLHTLQLLISKRFAIELRIYSEIFHLIFKNIGPLEHSNSLGSIGCFQFPFKWCDDKNRKIVVLFLVNNRLIEKWKILVSFIVVSDDWNGCTRNRRIGNNRMHSLDLVHIFCSKTNLNCIFTFFEVLVW